jgi:hypothetical protein
MLLRLSTGKSPGFAPLKILSRLGCSCQYPALSGKIIGITLWHTECRLRLSIGLGYFLYLSFRNFSSFKYSLLALGLAFFAGYR